VIEKYQGDSMRRDRFAIACLFVLLITLVSAGLVSAHTTVTNGPYNVEIGWLDEPPIVGQMNAIVMNLSSSDGQSTPVPESISGLTLTVLYGGQSKILTLQPLGEDTPGQYVAPILPMVAGLYTVDVNGTLGTTTVSVQVRPEEVQAPDSVQFPKAIAVSTASSLGPAGWLALAGLAVALAALVLALLSLRKSR
jgi:hypothetical protein